MDDKLLQVRLRDLDAAEKAIRKADWNAESGASYHLKQAAEAVILARQSTLADHNRKVKVWSGKNHGGEK